jgi:hypothetical protein
MTDSLARILRRARTLQRGNEVERGLLRRTALVPKP